MKHFCVYFIQNCRGGCLHPPELRGDVGIAPYNKAASPQPPLNLQVISNLYKAVRRSRSLCYAHVRFRY